jgi:mannose-6-phosphate isomerase-like protein (cupin superfamily)
MAREDSPKRRGAVMRLVITGHDEQGRSVVISDSEVAERGMVHLFTTGLDPSDTGPGSHAAHIASVPPAGSASWFFLDLSPDDVVRASLARGVDGIDADGWHTTPTVDYLLILDGTVSLALDTTEVELRPGDCVVQRGTRHAWRNRGTTPVRMMAVMVHP